MFAFARWIMHGSDFSLSGHNLHKLLIMSPFPCSINDRKPNTLLFSCEGVDSPVFCMPWTHSNKQSQLV